MTTSLLLFRSQIVFNQRHVQLLPGFPRDNGSDALINFYVNYPNGSTAEVVPRNSLVFIIFAQLGQLKNDTNLNLILQTSVTPLPRSPTADERNNSIVLYIISFNQNQVC